MINNLVQLNVTEEEARIIIGHGISGHAKFYIMNCKDSKFHELTAGELQNIQSNHPKKTRIYLEPFTPVIYKGFQNSAKDQSTNYLDLWVDENDLKNILKSMRGNVTANKEIDLSDSIYWNKLENMTKRAIQEYPLWKLSRNTDRKIQKTQDLKDWLVSAAIGADSREAEIIKKTLSDYFNELK